MIKWTNSWIDENPEACKQNVSNSVMASNGKCSQCNRTDPKRFRKEDSKEKVIHAFSFVSPRIARLYN